MPALVGPASGKDVYLPEACLLAPCGKVGAREVKRVAELDQHVERHQEAERVFVAGVVDDVLDDDMGPALRQRVVGRLDQLLHPLERYGEGPSSYERDALAQPTAREVAEGLLRGAADVQTDPHTPAGCLATLGTTYCADDSSPVGKPLIESRLAGHAAIRERFEPARAEGDLPADADPKALTHYIGAVVCGMAVLAASGATRNELESVIRRTMRAWPQ